MNSGAALRRESISADHLRLPAQVVELAHRQFTGFQKWTGRGLDERGRLGRLLLFRNLAFEADLESKWNRSDFFWTESNRQLKAFARDGRVWETAASGTGMTPDALKAAVIDELFVRTLLALNHAAAKLSPEKPVPGNREFAYTGHLRGVLDAAGADAERQAELLVPLADRWIKAEGEANRWKQAIAITRDMIARLPQEHKYPEQLMLLEFQATRDSLTQGPLKPKDTKKLKAGIERLEQLRKQYTFVPLVFTLIGRLRHLLAIALGNHNELSEALVESRKGMDYAPGDEEAAKTDTRLVESMKALQTRMQAVLQQVRTGYNQRLTLQGQKLAKESAKGFSAMNEYMNSSERAAIRVDADSARDKNIWLDIGYPPPAEEWASRADLLYDALTRVLGESRSNRFEIDRLVYQHVAPLNLDPRPAAEFLLRRAFKEGEPKPDAPAEQAANSPELQFQCPERIRGDEAFLFWVFSHQGLRLKAQASIALLILVCALTLTGFDSLRRSRQDSAYRALMAASAQGDFSKVIDASEDFLSHPALHGDYRTPQVRGLYSEALVRWFSLTPGTPDEAALKRVRRYQQLEGQMQQEVTQ